ncbi:tobamovirus multiplication protein 1-like isoform X2 [Juglans microcarpa x Juglans regia]|uniref:tobamovirus multiplication protein 1-like isoform X2 n=1 Tax=Juglans microcarpa x Juglans regia TaxID=2249226 RepID=UPI001B7D940E|nr:tobamovirus multiplication protein 1-like isoform X2 [Juglans microcarpa x Juglans regia]
MSVAKSTNIFCDHELARAVTLSHVAHSPSSSLMAWMQRTKSFVLREGEIQAALGVLSWWDEIDESEQWQRGIYYTLCVCYASVSFVALVQLVRIQLRVPEYGWTTQKLFHLMNFIVNGLRALLFALYQSVFLIKPRVLEMVLMDLPGLLFFSTYTLLVLFWAEIYHQVFIWIFIRLSQSPVSVKAAKLFFSVMSFSVALGFLIYGGRLFFMLRRFPIESRGRQKKLYEVGCVTGICCACFLIRCFVLALATVDKDADIDVLDHPILNLIYYMLVEIVPSALVLFILRKLPPKRVSDHYQPIS